jgi:dTDP-4-dehydrorhamnose 3,5-epimerase
MATAIKDGPQALPPARLQSLAIEGAVLRESSPIVTANGVTLELFSAAWGLSVEAVKHLICVRLDPGAISAWHHHKRQTDQLCAIGGAIRVVLFDGREGSRTQGRIEEVELSASCPALLVVPPGIWHGVQNMAPAAGATFVNLFDQAYEHGDPDEWRLPLDNDLIPYDFASPSA